MDIEKLIEQLRKSADFEDYPVVADFAAIIEKKYLRQAAEALATLRSELEKVKAERDTAVEDLTFAVNQYRMETTGISLCGLCEYDLPPAGENGQTAECPGFYVDDCFKWRGQKEE